MTTTRLRLVSLLVLLGLLAACGAAPDTVETGAPSGEMAEMAEMDEMGEHEMDEMDQMDGTVGTMLGTLETTSDAGHFRLSASSEAEMVSLNEMHAWTLRLSDADGAPVEGAAIAVDGGMPAHGHGLPTEPRVTQELGGGEYRLEGVRFNMAGEWELTLGIQANGVSDEATLSFELQ